MNTGFLERSRCFFGGGTLIALALDIECVAAEKFLANADRGLDESTKSRDAIDLATLRKGIAALKSLTGKRQRRPR